MLAGSGFGDQTGFSHFFRQQRLAEHIVDLMGAGVIQILPLQIDPGAAQILGHAFGVIQPGGTARVFAQQFVQFLIEFRIIFVEFVGIFQFNNSVHQGLRDVLPTVDAKASFLIYHFTTSFPPRRGQRGQNRSFSVYLLLHPSQYRN